MTARVVAKREVARILDLLIARGLPPSSLVAIPGGRVKFNLIPDAANDDGTDAEAREWDEALKD